MIRTLLTSPALTGYLLLPDLKCADSELELYLRWDMMEQMGKLCGWASPPRLYCKKVGRRAACSSKHRERLPEVH
jgi:hypothetical protein